jgi:hypothetical protein
VKVEEGGAVVISQKEKVSDHHAPKVDGVAIAAPENREVDVMESSVWVADIVYSGHTSAVRAMARFGSAGRGDPLYEIVPWRPRWLSTVARL